MSIFAQAAGALFAATSACNGGTVTFTRTGVGSVNVTATFGKSILDVGQTDGSRIEVETNDFIVLRASLVVANVLLTPQEGDRVVSNGITYLLVTPPYTPSGPTQVTLRLHSKIISP